MSVYVSSVDDLRAVCECVLAVHRAELATGFTGEKVADLFRAILIAQHAAYAATYGDKTTVPAAEFPTWAPARLIVHRPDLKKLYGDLRMLRYNTVSNDGTNWLPGNAAAVLDELITQTAAMAAQF